VEIFAPFRRNPIQSDFWTFHKANRKVKLTYLGKKDPINTWFLPKFLQLFFLNLQFRSLLRRALAQGAFDLLYTRSPAILPTLLGLHLPTVLELHTLPKKRKAHFAKLCNRCKVVASLTSPMRQELLSSGVREDKVILEHDAVDLAAFRMNGEGKLQKSLHLPLDTLFIGYAGQLTSMGLSKGIPELLDAFHILHARRRRLHLLIVGPASPDLALMHRIRHTEGVTYCGYVRHEKIPALLSDCTVLVYPAPASKHSFYQRDTSPLKVFEYMAAGKPIVAANLLPLRDILNEDIAYLAIPGDAQDLARRIAEALENPLEAQAKATRASEAVKHHTWEKRMGRIMERAASHS
jgi:glycosyltransferase involved in cell wall biosynthesis